MNSTRGSIARVALLVVILTAVAAARAGAGDRQLSSPTEATAAQPNAAVSRPEASGPTAATPATPPGQTIAALLAALPADQRAQLIDYMETLTPVQQQALGQFIATLTPVQQQKLLQSLLAQARQAAAQRAAALAAQQDGACTNACVWISGPDSPGTTGFCYSSSAPNQCSAARGSPHPGTSFCASGQRCCCLAAGLPTPSNVIR